MKGFLKKSTALCALILVVLLVFPFGLLSNAEKDVFEAMDYEALWARKNAEEGEIAGTGVSEWVIRNSPFLGNDMTVLFYTDAFDGLTFRRVPFEDYENGPAYDRPGQLEELYLLGLYSEELQEILVEKALHKVDFVDYSVPDEPYSYTAYYQHLPYLRACIEAFGITKEELKEACRLSRSNPDAIRDKVALLSDAEFEMFKGWGLLSSSIDESYLLDALYLPDEDKVRELCLLPYGVAVNGRVLCASDLASDYQASYYTESQELRWWKAFWEEVLSFEINTPGMRRFIENANAVAHHYDWLTNQPYRRNIAALEKRVAELDIAEKENPPKTGEHTALYLAVLAVAVAWLFGTAVLYQKKKVIT